MLRSGGTVRGLTTAATLWVSAAIGVACAAGLFLAVSATAVVTLAVLVGLRIAKPTLLNRLGGGNQLVRLEYRRGFGTLGPVMRQLEDLGCRVRELQVEDDDAQCVECGGDSYGHHRGANQR